MLNKNSWKQKSSPSDSPNIFMLPQKDFIKINFDEATKGNPGVASSGGVFKYSQGNTIHLYAMDCGIESNNEVELYELKRGI